MYRLGTVLPSCFGVLLACGLVLGGCAQPAPQLPPSWDGLEHRPTKGIDAVYVRPAADFTRYQAVLIDPIEVAFKDNWNPNRGERGAAQTLSVSDVAEIRSNMASGFRKIFVDELTSGGYKVTEAPAVNALRLSAGLANVYITAPARDSFGPSRTFTVEPGEMTLVLELRDSVSNELLARVVDRKTGLESGRLQMTTATSNRADFERAVSAWARRLRAGLDTVHGKTP